MRTTILLGLLLLSACGKMPSVAETPEACADRFAKSMPQDASFAGKEVRPAYLFDVEKPDQRLMQTGIEGVAPKSIRAFGGNNIDAEALKVAKDDMNDPDEGPAIVYQAKRWLFLYRPERIFAPDEAKRHLISMCALKKTGLNLRIYAKSTGTTSVQLEIN